MKNLNTPTHTLKGSKLRSLAFAMLAKREYSKATLKSKLLSFGADPEELESLLNELENANYQSDQRMAGMLLRSQIRQGKGPQRVKMALQKHQIDQELILEDLAEVDWFNEALQLKYRKFGEEVCKDPKIQAKQIRFLQYRGYSMEVIFKVIKYKADE